MGHFSPIMIEIFMEIQTGDDTNSMRSDQNLSDKFLSRNYKKFLSSYRLLILDISVIN